MKLFGQRGDTLIEVSIALAIISMVLTGAYVVSETAFKAGQRAKQRSQAVNAAQEQAEALKSFRDSHTWQEFVRGDSAGTFGGVIVRQSIDCNPDPLIVDHCFHMKKMLVGGVRQWVPVPGGAPSLAGTSVAIRSATNDAPSPPTYLFSVGYGGVSLGGSRNDASTNHNTKANLVVVLADLDILK